MPLGFDAVCGLQPTSDATVSKAATKANTVTSRRGLVRSIRLILSKLILGKRVPWVPPDVAQTNFPHADSYKAVAAIQSGDNSIIG